MLIVCASASSTHGLTTTARLRDLLGTTATSDDSHMGDLVLRASDWAERHLGYPLLAQVYSETLPAYGGLNLVLSRTPVRGVLRVFDATDTGSATEIKSSEYRIEDRDAGFLSRNAGWEWTAQQSVKLSEYVVPGAETRPYLVEYVAGYALDGLDTGSEAWTTKATSTARDLPYDVEQAVLEKTREFYEGGGGVTSKRVGDLAITYSEGPGPAEKLLGPWRRYA